MENPTFWSITGEIAGIGPAVDYNGVEQPNKIEVRLRVGSGKFFIRTVSLPAAVPITIGRRLTISGSIDIFRSKKTNKDYERMEVLSVSDPDAPIAKGQSKAA